MVAWGQDWEGGITKGREKVLEVIVMLIILTVVIISWVYNVKRLYKLNMCNLLYII